eukprot:6176769-Pleurochrysis_carterae.AAC.1
MQQAGAATTVARKASTKGDQKAIYSDSQLYSQMTACTVKVSDSEPFQSAAIRVSGKSQEFEKHTSAKKKQNEETRTACKI